MSFFKRLFSSSYREAVALEGAGRYREAARHYMLADDRASVARMHRLLAREQENPYDRVTSLRKALDVLPGDADASLRSGIRRDLAAALEELVERSGVMDRRDKRRLEEAASIYESFDDHAAAGEVYARLGLLTRAAEAFKEAGDIRRMEEMFHRAESADVAEAEFDRAYDAYEFAIMAKDYVGAIEAMRRCVELRSHDAGLSARLQELEERMPDCGRLTLRGEGGWTLIGGDVIGIGREENNEILLLDSGVSRQHARLVREGESVVLEDVGSSHGTFVGSARLQRPISLDREGTFKVGGDIELKYAFSEEGLFPAHISVTSGYLKGQAFTWAEAVVTTGIPPEEPAWLPPGLALAFRQGYWHVIPGRSQGAVSIDGDEVTTPTLLRLEDVIAFDDATLKVE